MTAISANQTGRRTPRDTVPLKRIGYRVNDFCTIAGISRTTLYELIREGKIKTILLGGRRIIPASEAERIISEG
jgi:excisionase family DNA binding protein